MTNCVLNILLAIVHGDVNLVSADMFEPNSKCRPT